MIKISAKVGVGGANHAKDVTIVQQLLRNSSRFLVGRSRRAADEDCVGRGRTATISPARSPAVKVTGKIDDDTIAAIKLFQKNVVKLSNPDGRVDPSGRTLGKLVNPGSGPFFPFPKIPTDNWTSAPRSYGARRSNGKRAHAGCDLYFSVGTWIYAVADGIVVANPRSFYRGTDQISIYHPTLGKTLRYGEIKSGSAGRLKKGSQVLAGTRLAKVGKMTGLKISMLHFEVYSGNVSPRLDTSASAKKLQVNGKLVSTKRLSTLTDPTPLLNAWKLSLPKAYA